MYILYVQGDFTRDGLVSIRSESWKYFKNTPRRRHVRLTALRLNSEHERMSQNLKRRRFRRSSLWRRDVLFVQSIINKTTRSRGFRFYFSFNTWPWVRGFISILPSYKSDMSRPLAKHEYRSLQIWHNVLINSKFNLIVETREFYVPYFCYIGPKIIQNICAATFLILTRTF